MKVIVNEEAFIVSLQEQAGLVINMALKSAAKGIPHFIFKYDKENILWESINYRRQVNEMLLELTEGTVGIIVDNIDERCITYRIQKPYNGWKKEIYKSKSKK
jgi:hypothetical protein